jgi:hypothetical protein
MEPQPAGSRLVPPSLPPAPPGSRQLPPGSGPPSPGAHGLPFPDLEDARFDLLAGASLPPRGFLLQVMSQLIELAGDPDSYRDQAAFGRRVFRAYLALVWANHAAWA